MTKRNPYGSSATRYAAAGWIPLPVPAQKKSPPPAGFTGARAKTPTKADIGGWIEESPQSNVALRLPDGVVGLDVDHYGDKTGAVTLANLESRHGPLPRTWISTSRPETPSGIRMFRVPTGSRFTDSLLDIDVIQPHHRFVVAAPSVHPEDRTYVWLNPAGEPTSDIPSVEDLPPLPDTWQAALTTTVNDTTAEPAELAAVHEAVLAMPEGEPCHHVQSAAGRAFTAGSHHDGYMKAVAAVIRYGRMGCPGARLTLTRLHELWLQVAEQRRAPGEAEQEWVRFLTGTVVGDILQSPQGSRCSGGPEDRGAPEDPEQLRTVKVVPLHGVEPEPVVWLHDQKVAIGELTLLAGREGLGKTTFTAWLAAAATRGELDGDFHGQKVPVLWVSNEDSRSRVLVPRLKAAGADMRLVATVVVEVGELELGLQVPRDMPSLAERAAESGAKLVVLDPLSSFLDGGLDTHRELSVRKELEPVRKAAERGGFAVIAVAHWKKSKDGDFSARINGSQGFSGVARSILQVMRDPDDQDGDRKLFFVSKSNLANDQQPSIAFRTVGATVATSAGEVIPTSKIELLGEDPRGKDQLLESEQTGAAEHDDSEWLTGLLLEHGGSLPYSEIKRLAAADDIHESRLKRLRKKAGVQAERVGFGKGSVWRLPPQLEPADTTTAEFPDIDDQPGSCDYSGCPAEGHHHVRIGGRGWQVCDAHREQERDLYIRQDDSLGGVA